MPVPRCVEVVRFIKENGVNSFMRRISAPAAGGAQGGRGGDEEGGGESPEEAMMGRMGILVICRFERLMVEEKVRSAGRQAVHLRRLRRKRRLGTSARGRCGAESMARLLLGVTQRARACLVSLDYAAPEPRPPRIELNSFSGVDGHGLWR